MDPPLGIHCAPRERGCAARLPGEVLKGSDKRHLRGLAHGLRPAVQLGQHGLTDAVVEALEQALCDNELVKVKIAADRDERREIAAQLTKRTHSELAGLVGHMAIVFRKARKPENRKIPLPSESA